MKHLIVKSTIAIAVSLLLNTQAFAASSSSNKKTNEIVGLGSGVLVGTAFAGPLGGMIAGVFGLMIANDVNSDKELATTQALVNKKEQQLIVMRQQYNEADAKAKTLMVTLDKTQEQSSPEIATSIQFKTASSQLEQHYKNELDLLAISLIKDKKLTLALSGYADKRGDSNYNQALSEDRTLAVKHYLLSQGVPEDQLLTQSYGESHLVNSGPELEDNFFDRRVSLKLSDNINPITAATP